MLLTPRNKSILQRCGVADEPIAEVIGVGDVGFAVFDDRVDFERPKHAVCRRQWEVGLNQRQLKEGMREEEKLHLPRHSNIQRLQRNIHPRTDSSPKSKHAELVRLQSWVGDIQESLRFERIAIGEDSWVSHHHPMKDHIC